MAEFVRGVHSAVFGRLLRVQEDIRCRATPEREGIHFTGRLGQRVDASPVRFEQMNQIDDWTLSEAPFGTQGLGRRLRVNARAECWKVGSRNTEAIRDPVVE